MGYSGGCHRGDRGGGGMAMMVVAWRIGGVRKAQENAFWKINFLPKQMEH